MLCSCDWLSWSGVVLDDVPSTLTVSLRQDVTDALVGVVELSLLVAKQCILCKIQFQFCPSVDLCSCKDSDVDRCESRSVNIQVLLCEDSFIVVEAGCLIVTLFSAN